MTEQSDKKTPWDTVGNQFIAQYYQCFDNKETRPQVAAFYHPTESLLTFEGAQHKGREEIMKKFASVPLDNIFRQPTTVDCQPTPDGGVLVHVLGQLRNGSENDKVMGFSQTFELKMVENMYFLFHDIFRLVLHNFSA